MILPQLPHCSKTLETHDSFSSAVSPDSRARAWLTGSSSQNTQRRHRDGKSSRLSNVMLARRRDNWHLSYRGGAAIHWRPDALIASWNVGDVLSGMAHRTVRRCFSRGVPKRKLTEPTRRL